MKKIILFITAMSLLLSLAVLPARAAVTEDEGIISLLKELEIMQGDENGDMMLDKKVSRAEFAKIAIAASPQKNSVALGLKQSPYKDVPYTMWYAPYVKAAVSAGYVVGYLDATFRPDNTVTYEEAATILIRVLGYDDSTFTDAYPYGQLSKAESLEILDDINAQIGDELTRYQVMKMVYNALNAQTSSNTALYTAHDCTLSEDADVISTSEQDDSLGTDKVFTSKGTYTKGAYFDNDSVGRTGDIYIKNGKDLIAFIPDTNRGNGYETYCVYSVLSNNTIIGYNGGSFSEIDIPDGSTVYKNQSATSYAAIKNSLEMGDTLYIKYTSGGSVDYLTYDSNNLNGPVTVTSDYWLAAVGANSSSTVYRSGVRSSISAVSTNDIVYYSEPLDVVFAYTDKVTGVYESASPNKDTPTTVTVSGKTYEIESVDAFNALSSSGGYKYGDTVTLLLGKNGDIAGLAGRGSASASASGGTTSAATGGFVIATGKKNFTNADNTEYTSYYAQVVLTDGTLAEYETSYDSSALLCSAVRITFADGKAKLSKSSSGSVSGKVSAANGTIGDKAMSDNIKIIDTVGSAATDTLGAPMYARVYPQRLDGLNLSSSKVLYSSTNGSGEIEELILSDVTGDLYTYGLVLSRTNGSYKIDIDGVQNTYATGFSNTALGPYRLKMTGNSIFGMQAIGSYSTYITNLTETTATISGQTYYLSENVVVYQKSGVSTYLKIPIEEAIAGNYKMTAYYDKAQSSGGRIRIIIAE